jgi:alginate O-acetyltransferase complex protein AlgI
MAIGMGLMLGFNFPENFNYPYIAKSIREFWRRWHISLSTWLKDYLYIPLGGNRYGKMRTYLNLWIVFLLCGLWHGASWNFVLWGAWHGLFLVIERAGFERILQRRHVIIQHGYALLPVMTGWIIFRSEDMNHTWLYAKVLLGDQGAYAYARSLSEFASVPVLVSMIVGALAATGLPAAIVRRLEKQWQSPEDAINLRLATLQGSLLVWGGAVLFLSIIHLYNGAYNPFIYFRF